MTRSAQCLVALILLAPACSTVAPAPGTAECSADADCTVVGEICAPDTRVCVPGSAVPPRQDLSFDIQDPDGLRVEIGGCDCELAQDTANNTLTLKRRDGEQIFELAIYRDAEVDPATATPEDVVAAEVSLSGTTRFSLGPASPTIAYPSTDAAAATLVPTEARWPRYHPYDEPLPPQLAEGGSVTWLTVPTSGAGPVYRLIRPPQADANRTCTSDETCNDPEYSEDLNFCLPSLGECTFIGDPHFAYTFTYDAHCNRELMGTVMRVDAQTLEPILDGNGKPLGVAADLTLRYADPEEGARFGEFALNAIAPEARDDECNPHDVEDPDDDEGCAPPETFCEPVTKQCVLALAGRVADAGSVKSGDDGKFATNVYSYCERETDNLALDRSFTITATPGGGTPSVDYAFDVRFGPFEGDLPGPTSVPKTLCIPDWGTNVGVTLSLVGEPVKLLGSGAGAYECCDTSCLPATEADAMMMGEPPSATECDGRTGSGQPPLAAVDTPLVDKLDPQTWEDAGCLPPLRGDDNRIGGIRTSSIPCNATEGTCRLEDLAAGRDGGARDYTVRIEMPVGSLFRSISRALPIDTATADEPKQFDLQRRVLVRGRVRLDDQSCAAAAPADGDCGSEGALVIAERLRMPGEPVEKTIPPYFHQASTFYDPVGEQRGAYILPLDPGVYLLTALPISGSHGGPADIEIIDIRDGQDIDHDLVLEAGVIVTLDLSEGFDRSTQVVPLDRGSWRELDHPGRIGDADATNDKIDLNAPSECMSSSGDGRCRIRRLIAGSSIIGNQAGLVRFIARSHAGAGSCPAPAAGACPPPR